MCSVGTTTITRKLLENYGQEQEEIRRIKNRIKKRKMRIKSTAMYSKKIISFTKL